MGYRDCNCCGTVYMHTETDDRNVGPVATDELCETCAYAGCDSDGGLPDCLACIVDGAAGIYVPRSFARNYNPEEWGISSEEHAILSAGPDHDLYWDTWDDVLNGAEFTKRIPRAKGGEIVEHWALEQDGDLFARLVSVDPYEIA